MSTEVWKNQKVWYLSRLGFSAAVIVAAWFTMNCLSIFFAEPREMKPECDETTANDIRKERRVPLDAALNKLKAIHIVDALRCRELENGMKLIRIMSGKSDKYWDSVVSFEQLKSATFQDSTLKFFWKELGTNSEYRVVYVGPLDAKNDKDFLDSLSKLNGIKAHHSALVIERVVYFGQDEFQMFYEEEHVWNN